MATSSCSLKPSEKYGARTSFHARTVEKTPSEKEQCAGMVWALNYVIFV